MKLMSLRDLYVAQLKDLYSAETQITKALPKLAKAAVSDDLRQAFLDHLEETREHVKRLERIFKGLEISPKGQKCKGMEGLLEEGEETLKEECDPGVLDAALIADAQRVEHYEMAGYGCVRTYATELGEDEAAELLQETLNEEAEADKKLTKLAESSINAEALAASKHEA